jgi:uncharacterized membrane protein YkoI
MHIVTKIVTNTLLTVLLSCLLTATTVEARSNKGVSKNKAVSTAVSKFPGKVVKVSGHSKFYQIRVLQKNGRVVTVKVDKLTGQILNSRKRGR